MSLFPCARKGRQTFDPRIFTLNESHSNHNSVVFQQRTAAEGLTQLQKVDWELAASSEAPEQLVLHGTPWNLKAFKLMTVMALQENQLEDRQVKRWFLILTSSHLLCNSLSSWFFNWAGWIPGNPETGACLSFKNLIRVFFVACSLFHPIATLHPCSAWQAQDALLTHLSQSTGHVPLLPWMKGEKPSSTQSSP